MKTVLWNDTEGAWFDYDLKKHKQRQYFAATNLSPLFFGCFDASNKPTIARKVLKYINANIDDTKFPDAIPTILIESPQHIDLINAWAPFQHMLTEGLRSLDDDEATKLSDKWTTRWMQNNYEVFSKYGNAMFEKVHKLYFCTNSSCPFPCSNSNCINYIELTIKTPNFIF